MNRETARRKVERLVEKDILERDGRGNINFAVGLIQEGRAAKLIYEQLEAARRFMEEQVRNGVLQVR
jgi:DNA-binding IclR family transcriptional regulator